VTVRVACLRRTPRTRPIDSPKGRGFSFWAWYRAVAGVHSRFPSPSRTPGSPLTAPAPAAFPRVMSWRLKTRVFGALPRPRAVRPSRLSKTLRPCPPEIQAMLTRQPRPRKRSRRPTRRISAKVRRALQLLCHQHMQADHRRRRRVSMARESLTRALDTHPSMTMSAPRPAPSRLAVPPPPPPPGRAAEVKWIARIATTTSSKNRVLAPHFGTSAWPLHRGGPAVTSTFGPLDHRPKRNAREPPRPTSPDTRPRGHRA